MDNNNFETEIKEQKVNVDKINNSIKSTKSTLANFSQKEYPSSMELKVVIQKDITTYLHRSLPLCIVLAFDKYKPWFYCNFIQIFSFKNTEGDIEFNFLEPRDCCSEIVDMINLGYPLLTHVNSIVDYIIENINMGYYLIINVDEFYLPNKKTYNISHLIHPSLIYGYDNNKQELKAIGFNQNIFEKITFEYTQFNDAYFNGKKYYQYTAPWAEWSAIQLIRPKNFEVEYPFSIKRLLNELYNYQSSVGDSIRLYSFEYYENQVVYGFKVYDEFIKSMEDLLQGRITSDYRAIHLIAEHKKCIYDRIGFVIDKYNLDGEIINLHHEYSEIVNQVNIVRLKLLKNYISFGNTNIYNPTISDLSSPQKVKIQDIIQQIKCIKLVEYDLLCNIINQLKLFFSDGNTGNYT